MSVDEKTIIKYLDIIIVECSDINLININNILFDKRYFNPKVKSQLENAEDIIYAVKEFGQTYGYFGKESSGGYLKLTKEGIAARNIKGHNKYQKSLKKNPLTLYQKIFLIFFTAFGFFGIYKYFQSENLKTEYNSTQNENKLLKEQVNILEKRIDSLNSKENQFQITPIKKE
ncbi:MULTISPECIES: hypothetical protein [Winogradskyella]|uniref:hypothetical protein n=1 Tax=Winogradskyella TaxID=286104 RepID=UPI0015C6EF2C|nr:MULTISPECIES: hypothetical protein [Winogradskyella]QXP78834.1 hypothetical protein H0I32_16760 [Winogradskyella sp. HaHa_3_26]